MNTKKYYLFCPGPVNISQNVKEAVRHEIGHREIEFSLLLASINKKILKLYQIENTRLYHPIMITGSGTAANESVLSSIVGDSNILILSNGEFGERLFEISKLHNENSHILKFDWTQKFDMKKIEKYVKDNKIKIIAMVHHETSTGMLNPIEKVGSIAKKYELTYIVDSVSSIGAEKIDIEKCNISFIVGTSGKAIGSLPGVGFIIGKKKEFKKLKDVKPKTMYLNLYKLFEYSINHLQTPNTPAVQLFFALEQALDNILQEGIEYRLKHIALMTKTLRKGMQELGLSFVIDEKDMSCVLTTVKLPKYISFQTLKHNLRERNIIIYNGKGPLLNKAFQVGNIGAIDKNNVDFFLNELKEILLQAKNENKNIRNMQKIRFIKNLSTAQSQTIGGL